jgi:heme exporter protein D
MKNFLYMDGYAFFVWSAYAVVVVIMTANLIYPLRRRRRLLREISQQASQNGIDDTET